MVKKLFYMLNIFACIGLSSCNSINMSKMDDNGAGPSKKRKTEYVEERSSFQSDREKRKEESDTSSESGSTSKQEEIDLRREFVNMLSEMSCKELGAYFPEEYKDFLVANDPITLKSLKLDPFYIFSFQMSKTPQDEKVVKNKLDQLMTRQRGLVSDISIDEVERKKIKKPWCIAVQDIDDKERDQIVQEYYYIDLNDKQDNSIYKQDIYGKIASIHKRLGEFLSFCEENSKNIRRSLDKS